MMVQPIATAFWIQSGVPQVSRSIRCSGECDLSKIFGDFFLNAGSAAGVGQFALVSVWQDGMVQSTWR